MSIIKNGTNKHWEISGLGAKINLMAIFLVLYGIFLVIWLIWALIITYHFYKYRFPDKTVATYLITFWAFSGLILIISMISILQADWKATPDFFKIIGV